MSASITYNSFEFAAGSSRPWISARRTFIAETEGAPPVKARVEYTVKTWFLEPGYADNQARYSLLVAALKTATEGVLVHTDENGNELTRTRVRVGTSDLAEQWGEHLLEVTVVFHATEDLTAGASTVAMTYTPTGGLAINLPNVIHFSESIRANRYSDNLPNRRETVGTIAATGKVRANPNDTPADRRTYLLAQKAIIDAAIDSKEGALAFAGFSKTVKIEVLATDPADGTEELSWSLQASYLRFPAGDYAEAEFTVKQRDNLSSSERVTTVQGRVRADDEAGALTKIAAIQATYLSGRILLDKEVGTPRLDGADGTAFVDVSFALTFRETIGGTSYKLDVTSRDDTRTGQVIITYSGTVTAATSSVAVTEARALGDAKHPIRMVSQETISVMSVAGATSQFVQVAFCYEYLTKGSALYAEVTSDVERNTFGANVQSVSGYAVAASESAAFTLARSFKPTGLMQRTGRESSESVKKDGTAQFVKVTFSYSYHIDALTGAIEYGIKTSEDLSTREKTVIYSGNAYGPDEATANSLIDALVAGASGSRMLNEREAKYDKTASAKFKLVSFNVAYRAPLAAGSDDILEAEWSVENIYSFDRAVLTEIPFSTPHVQTSTGGTAGTSRVSGRMLCLNLSTALTWARAKTPGGGYQVEAPRERAGYRCVKMSGTSVATVTLEFDYSRAYPTLAM